MRNLLLIFSAIFLISCKTTPDESTVLKPLNIYQPSILVLEKGETVNTKEGIYTTQTEEVWHSDKRFRELERQIYSK